MEVLLGQEATACGHCIFGILLLDLCMEFNVVQASGFSFFFFKLSGVSLAFGSLCSVGISLTESGILLLTCVLGRF